MGVEHRTAVPRCDARVNKNRMLKASEMTKAKELETWFSEL